MTDTEAPEAPAETPEARPPAHARNVLGIRVGDGDLYIDCVTPPGEMAGHPRYDRRLKHFAEQNGGERPAKLEDVTVNSFHIDLIPGKVLVATDDGWQLLCRPLTAQETAELNGTETLHPLETQPVWRKVDVFFRDQPLLDMTWQEFSAFYGTSSQIADWKGHVNDTEITSQLESDGRVRYSYFPPIPTALQGKEVKFVGTVRIGMPRHHHNFGGGGTTVQATMHTFTDPDGYSAGEITLFGIENAKPRLWTCEGFWWVRE